MQLNYGNLIEKAKNGEFDVIIHGANCFHTMGAGIAKFIKLEFPEVYEADKKTISGDIKKVGTFSEANIERNGNKFVVINAYTQYRYGNDRDQFEYDSFPSLLQSIKAKYGNLRIGLPLIGCGLAGGDEIRILKMIKENFEGLDYKLVELDVNRKLKIQNDIENKSSSIQENNKFIAFTKVALPFGWMGNMAAYPVEHNGVSYKTTEALFQSLRFRNHPDIQEAIRQEKSPMSAKMVAKDNKHLLEADGYELMGQQDIENMKLCINLKLEQHPELKQQLIDTGNLPIIEDCTSRPQGSGIFWGAVYQNGGWNGDNILGNILMDKRTELQNNKEQNMKQEYTYFFQLTSPFSNFHPAKFEYKALTFISNEQFMMYSKAKNFKDDSSAEKILALNQTPIAKDFIDGKITREQIVNNKDWANEWNQLMMAVKKIGRDVKNFDEGFWNRRREGIVLFGAREKFTQNEDLKQVLLNTGNTFMVEASRYDPIWSCGLSEYDAKRTPPEQWPGLNLLGKVLDTLKAELQNNLVDTASIKKKALNDGLKPIEVCNIYHLNKIIPEDGVYIGRANKGLNLSESKFANPFAMKNQSEEERIRVVSEFKDWMWKQISANQFTKDDLITLNGKKLVCYCGPQKLCHGDVLKETVELLISNETEFDKKVQEYMSQKKLKP